MLTGMAYRGHYTSNFFRLRRAKNVTRFQEMYVNCNGVPRPVFFFALFLSFNRKSKLASTYKLIFIEFYWFCVQCFENLLTPLGTVHKIRIRG